MIVNMRKWIDRFKFIVLFVVLTFVLYHMLGLLSTWLEPANKYRQPTGTAVKAFNQDRGTMDAEGMADRLKLFYWYGE